MQKALVKQVNTRLIELEHGSVAQYLLLAAITLCAAALRFYKLGQWSFWGDEYITVRRALTIFEAGFSSRTISLMSTHAALDVWGISEWSARLPAAVAGVLSIPVLYFLVRKIFDPVVAFVSSLLLAVAPWHIYWSQNARFYTLLLLFYTLALLLFYMGIEQDRPGYLVLALAFLGLALQERLTAALFVPIVAGYIVLLKLLPFAKAPGLRLRNLAIFFGPGLIGALFLILTHPSVRNPAQWIKTFGFVNNNPFWILGGVVFYMGIPLVCMAALGALYLLWQKNRAALLLSLASVIPLLAVLVISLVQYTANRYVFVSLPSVIVLAAVAAKELWWQLPARSRILGIGILLILFLAPMGDNLLYYRYQNGNRDDWKGAFAFIATQKEEGDVVMTTHRELANYYLQQKTVGMQSRDIAEIVQSRERIWLVLDLTAPDKAPEIYRWVKNNARQVADLDVTVSARTFPMDVYVYEPTARDNVSETDP